MDREVTGLEVVTVVAVELEYSEVVAVDEVREYEVELALG